MNKNQKAIESIDRDRIEEVYCKDIARQLKTMSLEEVANYISIFDSVNLLSKRQMLESLISNLNFDESVLDVWDAKELDIKLKQIESN